MTHELELNILSLLSDELQSLNRDAEEACQLLAGASRLAELAQLLNTFSVDEMPVSVSIEPRLLHNGHGCILVTVEITDDRIERVFDELCAVSLTLAPYQIDTIEGGGPEECLTSYLTPLRSMNRISKTTRQASMLISTRFTPLPLSVHVSLVGLLHATGNTNPIGYEVIYLPVAIEESILDVLHFISPVGQPIIPLGVYGNEPYFDAPEALDVYLDTLVRTYQQLQPLVSLNNQNASATTTLTIEGVVFSSELPDKEIQTHCDRVYTSLLSLLLNNRIHDQRIDDIVLSASSAKFYCPLLSGHPQISIQLNQGNSQSLLDMTIAANTHSTTLAVKAALIRRLDQFRMPVIKSEPNEYFAPDCSIESTNFEVQNLTLANNDLATQMHLVLQLLTGSTPATSHTTAQKVSGLSLHSKNDFEPASSVVQNEVLIIAQRLSLDLLSLMERRCTQSSNIVRGPFIFSESYPVANTS